MYLFTRCSPPPLTFSPPLYYIPFPYPPIPTSFIDRSPHLLLFLCDTAHSLGRSTPNYARALSRGLLTVAFCVLMRSAAHSALVIISSRPPLLCSLPLLFFNFHLPRSGRVKQRTEKIGGVQF